MIVCKKCGYEGVYEGRMCPHCQAPLLFSSEERLRMEEEYRAAVADGAHETAMELVHILADAGQPTAAAVYGRMLYEGDGFAENKTAALEYLAFAAEQGDAEGAFLYGRALSERGDEAGDFFLLYAALLGHKRAYEGAAQIFSSIGRDADAAAYLALAAREGSRTAALSLAHRYEVGEGGLPADPALAKWYLSLAAPLPPHAWPLAFRLRRVFEPLPAIGRTGRQRGAVPPWRFISGGICGRARSAEGTGRAAVLRSRRQCRGISFARRCISCRLRFCTIARKCDRMLQCRQGLGLCRGLYTAGGYIRFRK